MIKKSLRRKLMPVLPAILMGLALGSCGDTTLKTTLAFPSEQPKGGNFNKPSDGEILDVSPPGFCWWRAGDKTQVSYLVRIHSEDGKEVHHSPRLEDPVYIPSQVLEPGKYTWTVEALDADGKVVDVRKESLFEISTAAVALPWVDPAELLSRVPPSHPRLLFPEESLPGIRRDIETSLREPYEGLKESADLALGLSLMEKPLWDTITGEENYPAMRVAYRASFHDCRRVYLQGVVPMALTYLISEDKKYGEAVKSHLLHLCSWSLDGSLQVQNGGLDELGLTLARALPQAYDWTYDLFTAEERMRMENWMVALADSFLFRMESRDDFLNYPSGSHAGRLPAYFMEFALVLADRHEAVA